MKLRIITFETDSDVVQVGALLSALLNASTIPDAPVVTVPVAKLARPRQAAIPAKTRSAPADTADRASQILALLKFRSLRIPEIADALCKDKRDVKLMTSRLYPAMRALKKAGKVCKDGSAWALK